jgi:predicted ATPase
MPSSGEKRTYLLCRLAQAYVQSGETDRAWQTIVSAQSVSEVTAEHYWDAELHRVAGEVLFASGADAGEVEARYLQSIQTARQQCAMSLELRAALSLARLLVGQGRRAEARDLLAPIYARFTEGFETADLRKAGEVLAELSE